MASRDQKNWAIAEHLLLDQDRLTVIVACSGGIKRAETPRTGPVNVRMEREKTTLKIIHNLYERCEHANLAQNIIIIKRRRR